MCVAASPHQRPSPRQPRRIGACSDVERLGSAGRLDGDPSAGSPSPNRCPASSGSWAIVPESKWLAEGVRGGMTNRSLDTYALAVKYRGCANGQQRIEPALDA